MSPLVDVMKKEGKSVVLAPEGTRTISPKMAPFKKGAFHLAMQAGVPMVPIVIRNAGDVAPKGDFVFRPATVDVEVLPPVDTSNWRRETIDKHVREVRNMFARVLGQPEEPATPVRPAPKKKSAQKKAKTSAQPRTRAKPKAKTKAEAKAKPKAKSKTKAKPKAKAETRAKSKSNK